MSSRDATLADIAPDFDVFIVDQFGVLHDGTTAYPGAVEALGKLKAEGKTVILVSNSGKRAARNEGRMERLGFSRKDWDWFVSSGEVAWHMMARGDGPVRARGAKALVIAREGDRSAIDGLDMAPTQDGAAADIVLITASEGDRFDLDFYRRLLEPAARRDVPCLCTNPDRVMLTPFGPCFGAGRIGKLYEEMGGTVTWIGKPYRAIYDAALDLAGAPTPGRVVCVGDSVEHDILGARNAGLNAALVHGGILADMSSDSLSALYVRAGAEPDFVLPAFAWT